MLPASQTLGVLRPLLPPHRRVVDQLLQGGSVAADPPLVDGMGEVDGEHPEFGKPGTPVSGEDATRDGELMPQTAGVPLGRES